MMGTVAVARQRATRIWDRRPRISRGAKNTIGIKNPAVDALDRKGDSPRIATLWWRDQGASTACCSGISTVVPQFTYGFSRYARWDRFSHAEPMPKYGRSGLPSLWWFDADKAARIGKRS
jgi:microcin C transport system substrate-binding protein